MMPSLLSLINGLDLAGTLMRRTTSHATCAKQEGGRGVSSGGGGCLRG